MNISQENCYNYEMPTPPVHTNKTDKSYNNPGMPTPPAGYGTSLGFVPAKAPDTCS